MSSEVSNDQEIIEDFEAIRLLINIYLIKKLKSLNKPVNQEKFIDTVRKEFRNRAYTYPRKKILYTWKYLLDNYKYYKQHFRTEEARKMWTYFDLMDNCFDDTKQTSEKFKNSRWTFLLIESLSKHKSILLQLGLTMDILQAVEDDFRKASNNEINQKDVYNQWVFLKRFYRQNLKTGYYKQLVKNHAYFTALKKIFETDEPSTKKVSEFELVSAVESIKEEMDNVKKRKTEANSTHFTIVMHDILLQCFKRNREKIGNLNGSIDEDTLNEAFNEFKKLGYNVTKQSISNEWNDLSCRYDIIKTTEHPEKWPYYSDMNYIFEIPNEGSYSVDDQDNQSTIGSVIVESVRKSQRLKNSEYAVVTERLLNVYESNSKEFLEIKDILVERNLLREETNYLLNTLVDKLNKKKGH